MAFIVTKNRFHIALNGVGMLLQGSPDRPAYQSKNAPVYGTRFASGDRDYNDLSQWWYLTQTDWSGGFKDTFPFVDDAKFYYSTNVDVRTKPGSIRLERQLSLVRTETSEVTVVKAANLAGTNELLYISDMTRILSTGAAKFTGTDAGSESYTLHNHRGNVFELGTTVNYTGATGVTGTFPQTAAINTAMPGSIAIASAAVSVGNILYVFGVTSQNMIFCVSTPDDPGGGAPAWTSVFQTHIRNNVGAVVVGAELLGDQIVFMVGGTPQWNLYSLDIATGIASLIQDFDGTIHPGIYAKGARYIRSLRGKLIITVLRGTASTEGRGDIYTYDGTSLTRIYTTDEVKYSMTPTSFEAVGFLRGGATINNNLAYWGNLVYDGEHLYNWIKDFGDEIAVPAVPIGENSTNLIYVADLNITSGSDDQELIYSYAPEGTTYKDGANSEAFIVLNQHDKVQSIDKLMNQINLGFEKLVSGQEIRVYYADIPVALPAISNWTLLGSASFAVDGGSVTFKNFKFPVGTTAKKMWFRINLISGGTNTPAVTDFTVEYLPMPDYKKEWTVVVNCADELKTLAGSLVEYTGRELKAFIEKSWWSKSALDFQDLDYAATIVNDATLDATETTITVDDTSDFAEQGRLRIDDEEILYNGKTPTSFLNCIRGARGTRASTHADNAVVNNGYQVLILSCVIRAPMILEDKELEYTVALSLREV